MRVVRRKFNKVGCPQLPENPTIAEISRWLHDKAKWQEIQPYGREMDAREWAATCLNSAAEDLMQ